MDYLHEMGLATNAMRKLSRVSHGHSRTFPCLRKLRRKNRLKCMKIWGPNMTVTNMRHFTETVHGYSPGTSKEVWKIRCSSIVWPLGWKKHTTSSEWGVHQGDPVVTAGFCITIDPLVKLLRSPLNICRRRHVGRKRGRCLS